MSVHARRIFKDMDSLLLPSARPLSCHVRRPVVTCFRCKSLSLSPLLRILLGWPLDVTSDRSPATLMSQSPQFQPLPCFDALHQMLAPPSLLQYLVWRASDCARFALADTANMRSLGGFAISPASSRTSARASASSTPKPKSPLSSRIKALFKSRKHGTTPRGSSVETVPTSLTLSSSRSSSTVRPASFLNECNASNLLDSRPSVTLPDSLRATNSRRFSSASCPIATISLSTAQHLKHRSHYAEIVRRPSTLTTPPPSLIDSPLCDDAYLNSGLKRGRLPEVPGSSPATVVRSFSMDSSTVGRSPAPSELNGLAGGPEHADHDDVQAAHAQYSRGGTPQQAHTRVASPSNTRPTTSSSVASSHLSGLVCNVHRTTGKEPHPLVGATTTILGDCLFVFGGRRLSRTRSAPTSDLYQLDLLSRHWTKIEAKGAIPAARYFHSMCSLGSSKLVCYGGMSPEAVTPQVSAINSNAETTDTQVAVMSDIHIYDVTTRTWTKIDTSESPQGRYAHCAAILPSAAVFASANASVPGGLDQGRADGKGGAEMLIVGGQDSGNRYIEQISIFNLRSMRWSTTRPMPGRSCGAYRSVVIPLTTLSAEEVGAGAANSMLRQNDQRDPDDGDATGSGSPMLMYTNYNFLDVKLELQIRNRDGSLIDKTMQGSVSPPGLRFPNGGILNNHFVVSGTFLTSSKQEFALWALNLRTLTWAKIDTASSVFSQGSWNRGVLWPRRNAFVILGNRKRNLVDDYNNRRLNFTNMCLVQLEGFGLYDNPRSVSPTSDYVSASGYQVQNLALSDKAAGGRPLGPMAVALGAQSQAMKELADMDFVAMDGTRLPVNSRMIALRWGAHFGYLMHEAMSTTGPDSDGGTLRSHGFGDLSRNSSVTITPSINTGYSIATTLTANPEDSKTMAPSNRPRALYLPHTALTIRTLIYYLYTSSLPPTNSPMTTPQILCSLLQLARPYKVDGLLEAVIERLHESLDGRNAAAIFNAAAMGAGGGDSHNWAGDRARVSMHPPRSASLAGINVEGLNLHGTNSSLGERTPAAGAAMTHRIGPENGLRITTSLTNGTHTGADSDDGMPPPGSASTTASMSSMASALSRGGSARGEDAEIWEGGWSAVIGLQKRGLRGLMEGRRLRERGKGSDGTAGSDGQVNYSGPGSSGGVGGAAGAGAGNTTGGTSMMHGAERGRVGLGFA